MMKTFKIVALAISFLLVSNSAFAVTISCTADEGSHKFTLAIKEDNTCTVSSFPNVTEVWDWVNEPSCVADGNKVVVTSYERSWIEQRSYWWHYHKKIIIDRSDGTYVNQYRTYHDGYSSREKLETKNRSGKCKKVTGDQF